MFVEKIPPSFIHDDDGDICWECTFVINSPTGCLSVPHDKLHWTFYRFKDRFTNQ